MTPLRVVFVARRCWPLVGGAHASLLRLAVALKDQGTECTFLTFRWQRDWPERIEHHGVSLVRLLRPTTGLWGTVAHIRRIESWLMANCRPRDVICASGLRYEAFAAVRAAQRVGAAALLRPDGAGLSGDSFWQLDARCGRRLKQTCMSADAFLAPNRSIEQELIAAGYARDRIRYLPCGVPELEAANSAARKAARSNLASAQGALAVSEDALVALYAGRLEQSKGLADLVESWRPIALRWPSARLWIVGDGPAEAALRGQIHSLGLAASVVLPGTFDSLDDFWAAADLFVATAEEAGTSVGLLEAMAAGLPIVATDIPGHQEFIEDARQGLLVPQTGLGTDRRGIAAAISAAIERLWDSAELRTHLGAAARLRVRSEYGLDSMVQQFQEVVASALAQRAGNRVLAARIPTT